MTPKEYIKIELQKLIDQFPEMAFGYKFDQHSSTHVIRVEPLEFYSSNKQYANEEARIIYEFTNTYLSESILFVSEESLIKVLDPEFVVVSQNYIVKSNLESVLTPVSFKIDCRHSDCLGDLDLSQFDNYALAA